MKKKKRNWANPFIPIIIIIILIVTVFYFSYEFNCESDVSCYNRHLESCKKTKLTVDDKGSTFIYQILGKEIGRCKIQVTLENMPPETDQDTLLLFKGKSMTCLIDKNSNYNTEILPSCTGPLKEAIYELTIQKMYNILAQSLGDILSEI